jgi:hypothetical protein
MKSYIFTRIAGCIALSCFAITLSAQPPRGFAYQAVARGTDQQVIANASLTVHFSILNSSEDLIWKEEHTVTTSELGLFSVIICSDNSDRKDGLAASIEEIPWSSESLSLKVEVDDGSGIEDMGTHPLMAVPYALFALKTAGNEVDADADPTNEIQDLQLSGDELTITGNPAATPIDLSSYNESNVGWTRNGDRVVYINGNVGVGTVSPEGRLSVQGVDETEAEPLFMVTRKDGYPVFAVYEHGVYAFTDTVDSGKGIKGGFAVGGYRTEYKGIGEEYMRVNADSIRFYVRQDPQDKGLKGGFAVGGYRDQYKTPGDEFLRVTPDSVRVYIDDNPDAKGLKGGFAVGGYTTHYKGGNEYFNISGRSQAEIINGENRVVWYPQRNAFLAGNVLVESPDSVGENSMASGYRVKAKGAYSQAFGYQSVAADSFSIAIGKNAIASHPNSFAFGSGARAMNLNTYALGQGARASGDGAVAIGSKGETGFPPTLVSTIASGNDAFALGKGAQATQNNSVAVGLGAYSSGLSSVSLGYDTRAYGGASFAAGFNAVAEGTSSVSLGSYTLASGNSSFSAGSSNKATGQSSIAMGKSSLAKGYFSSAIGYSDTATAWGSTAIGYASKASGDFSFATGIGNEAKAYQSFVAGSFNIIEGDPDAWIPTDPIFVIGNGTDGSHRSNALRVLKNGTTEISGNLVTKSVYGTHINAYMLNDHMNGNVTLNALGQDLYLGYMNTQRLKFFTGTGSGIGTEKMTVTISGLVGINNTYPDYRLDVNGEIASRSTNAFRLRNANYSMILRNDNASFWALVTDNGSPDGSYNSLRPLRIILNSGDLAMGNNALYVQHGGNVGIGKTNPSYKLDVNGSLYSSNIYSSSVSTDVLDVDNTPAGSDMELVNIRDGAIRLIAPVPKIFMTEDASAGSTARVYTQQVDNNNFFIYRNAIPEFFIHGSGYMGIGTSSVSTSYKLTLLGLNGINKVYLGGSNTGLNVDAQSSGQQTGIYCKAGSITSGNTSSAISGVAARNTSGDFYSGRFYSSGTSGTYYGLWADHRTGANIDIAEYIYDTNKDTEAADIVIADPLNKESIIRSTSPYQSAVLGVVSTKPHMVLGAELLIDEETGATRPDVYAAKLALCGRIPVKVTDENGSIEPGDLLTTSSTPGHAMKWTLLDVNEAEDFSELKAMIAENDQRRNAIIGKAVESHDSGTGKIMVLVALQ